MKTRYFHIFLQLTRRHLLVFFRNKIRMFYTLMVPVIIFLVYIFFLRRMELSMIAANLPEGVTMTGELYSYLRTLVDSWMLAGISVLSVITVSLQTNNVLVEDKQNGVNRDFASSPVPKELLVASYFLFNFLVTSVIGLLFLLVCGVYLACLGEFMLTAADVLTVLAVFLFATVSTVLMTVLIASFVKREATMSSIVAVFSTAVGFLIGAYMPLGMMPDWVQGICAFIPGTYACSLLRYAFMKTPLLELSAYAQGLSLPAGTLESLLSQLSGTFGYDIGFFGVSVSPQYQALALAVYSVVFLALNIGLGKKLAEVLGIGKKKKKK